MFTSGLVGMCDNILFFETYEVDNIVLPIQIEGDRSLIKHTHTHTHFMSDIFVHSKLFQSLISDKHIAACNDVTIRPRPHVHPLFEFTISVEYQRQIGHL